MFEAKFGSPVGPFKDSTPQYDYWSTSHTLAVERLEFAVSSTILLTVFTGDAGSGKSTVLRKVVSDAQSQSLIGACTYGPPINIDPCRAILEAFGADPGPGDKEAHRCVLQQSLEAARYEYEMPTFVLDDAHQLKDEQVSNLFDLAGFEEGPQEALFKIILVGNPELLVRLSEVSSDLLGPSFALEPMSEKDTAGYIKHRLKAANAKNVPFDDDALGAIHERTGGNPQQINLLCSSLLGQAAALDILQIDSKWVHDCKIAPSQWFEVEQEPRAPMRSVSSTAVLSDEPKSELPHLKAHDSNLILKPEVASRSATKISAEGRPTKAKSAKSDSRPKTNDKAADSQAKEIYPSFKSTQTSQVTEQGKANNSPSNASQARNSPTDGLSQKVSSERENAKMPEPDLVTASTNRARPKRTRFALVALCAGAVSIAGLAYFTYLPVSFPYQLNKEVTAVVKAESSPVVDVTDLAAVGVNKETDGLSESSEDLQLNALNVDEASGVDLASTVAQPAPEPTDQAAQRVPLDLADPVPILKILDALGEQPEDVNDWYRLGLTVAGQNPRAAAVAYAVAASGDHPRAAYFLGQMYELGEGIPVDTMLARSWYERAGRHIDGAAERIAALPAQQTQDTPVTPIQLVSFVNKRREAVMVWTSGSGADPSAYTIEFADLTGEVVSQLDNVKSSVLRHTISEAVVYWRVRAHADDTASSAPTGWLPLDFQANGIAGAAPADP